LARRRRVLGTASTNDANALESLPVGRPDGKAHHVEIDERSNRFAKPLQHIAHLEAGSEDRRDALFGRRKKRRSRSWRPDFFWK
jgi:hypothetical protein